MKLLIMNLPSVNLLPLNLLGARARGVLGGACGALRSPRSLAVAGILAAAAAGVTAAGGADSPADPIAAAEAEMLALGLPTARIVETEQGPTVLAVAQVDFEPPEDLRAGLRAMLAASVRARAEVASLLEGPAVESTKMMFTRMTSGPGGAVEETISERQVRVVVQGVLGALETRRSGLDREKGVATMALIATPLRWVRSDALGLPRYRDATAAAEEIARELAEFTAVPQGAKLVRLEQSGNLAVVGLGVVALREGQTQRDGRLIAGRRAAAAAVAFLSGEEVGATDELQQMMREVAATDARGQAIPAAGGVEFKEQFTRTAQLMSRGRRPPGSVERDAAARIGSDTLVVAALVVEVPETR